VAFYKVHCYVGELVPSYWNRTWAEGEASDIQAPGCQRKLVIFGS